MTEELRKTTRATMSRHRERASYDRELAHRILDEAMVAHVGVDAGHGVMVLPMTYARIGDVLYLHGAVASRWLGRFGEGLPVSACVTLLDGLVLARSAFSHSMNYRSVVVFGTATTVTDVAEKARAFRALLDHLVPGRWDDTRQPTAKETAATVVLKVPIDEASIKVRSGPPKDSAGDYGLRYWAGVVPLELTAGTPAPDPAMDAGGAPGVPPYLSGYVRRPR